MVNSNTILCVIYNCQRPRKGKVIEFSSYVAPACLPKKSNRVTSTFRGNHCEIAGWGMQVSVGHSLKMWLHCLLLYFVYKEYNNTSSYPTSIRAAKIKVSITSPSNSNIAIQYRHRPPSFIFDLICFAWKVGTVRNSKCNSLYGRDVARTGKFCAGGKVDACQVITA